MSILFCIYLLQNRRYIFAMIKRAQQYWSQRCGASVKMACKDQSIQLNIYLKQKKCLFCSLSVILKHFKSTELLNNKIFLMLPAFVVSFWNKDFAYSLLMLSDGIQARNWERKKKKLKNYWIIVTKSWLLITRTLANLNLTLTWTKSSSRNFLRTFYCSGGMLSGSNYFFTAVKALIHCHARGEVDQ